MPQTRWLASVTSGVTSKPDVAPLTLIEAFAVRHALRTQLGSGPWEDVLTIARDPRPEVIAAQNSIWLCTVIPHAFRLVMREEPLLAKECGRILAVIEDFTRRIRRVEWGTDLAEMARGDTWDEARGGR